MKTQTEQRLDELRALKKKREQEAEIEKLEAELGIKPGEDVR